MNAPARCGRRWSRWLWLGLAAPAAAGAQPYSQAEAQALALAQETIALRSVEGPGNRTIDVARVYATALREAGWAEGDIEIVPVDDTAYLIATWPGGDPSLGPVVLSAHMDVVEAKPEDWERDPFTPVVENGFLFGRGASDTKFEASLAVATLIELRRQGFRPQALDRRRLFGRRGNDDEDLEGHRRAAQARAARAQHRWLLRPAAEETGRPLYWSWQGAEKTYIDFQLEVTNPGGHSSMPRPDNAIAQMSHALERIAPTASLPNSTTSREAISNRSR